MDPKFKTSFIPKSPIVSSSVSNDQVYRPSSLSLFSIIVITLFLASILASGFVFLSINRENSKIREITDELALAKQAFEPAVIEELLTVSNQIKSIKELMQKHISISNLFYLFQSITIQNTSFSSFVFDRSTKNITVRIGGEALSYGHASKQAQIFSETGFMSNISYTNLKLNEDGTVSINMNTEVDTNSISYLETIKRLSFLSGN